MPVLIGLFLSFRAEARNLCLDSINKASVDSCSFLCNKPNCLVGLFKLALYQTNILLIKYIIGQKISIVFCGHLSLKIKLYLINIKIYDNYLCNIIGCKYFLYICE